MRIAKRDLKLLLILAGLVIFLLLYMLVFNNFQARTDTVKAKIAQLEPQVQELEGHYLRLAEYESGIEDGRKNVNELLKSFPADVKEEDVLSYLLTMEAHEDIRMESVTFNTPELVQEFSAALEKDGADALVTTDIYRSSTVMSGSMTYPQAKNIINYFYDSPKMTHLENATLTYNAETGKLTGTFQLAKYFVTWDGAEYKPERVPSTSLGLHDLFGTT